MKKLAVFLMFIFVFAAGCSQKQIENADINKGFTKTSGQEIFVMAGKIEAGTDINVSSKIPAKATKVMVEVGDKVNVGEPLIYLDVNDIAAQVKQAEAAVNVAKAGLTKVQKAVRPEQILQTKAALNSAKVAYENAKNNLQRLNELYIDGSIPKQQLEAAQGQVAAAEAQYESAQEQLAMLSKGETAESIRYYQAQIQQAQAALDYAKTLLKNGVIYSPVSGTVSTRNIDPGELAVTGQPLLSIFDDKETFVNATVPTGFVDKIKTGEKVTVKCAELDNQKFSGEIVLINPVVDQKSKNILVKVRVDNEKGLLKPGMIVEIGIRL